MSDKPPFDPAMAVRDWFGQWEKIARDQGAQVFQQPGVKQAAAGTGALAAEAEAKMRAATESWLAAMNLPSRSEVKALADALQGVDARLARIEAALGTAPAAEPAPPPRRPRKTKKD